MHVVDVEQQRTAAAPRDLDEEFDLAILVRIELQVVRRIFQRNLPPDPLLHARDVVDQPPQRVGGARHRQQVRSIGALPGAPRQMLRHERRLDAFDQRREPLQMRLVRRRIGRQRQRDAVQRDRMRRADALEPGQPRSAVDHVVLGMHLEPQARARRRLRRLEMLRLQAQPGAQHGFAAKLIARLQRAPRLHRSRGNRRDAAAAGACASGLHRRQRAFALRGRHRRAGALRDRLPGVALVVDLRGSRAGGAGAGFAVVLAGLGDAVALLGARLLSAPLSCAMAAPAATAASANAVTASE